MKNPIYDGNNPEPIDGLAVRVVLQKGVHFDSKKRVTQLHWDTPPPIQKISPGAPDFTGTKFGQFTVVGKFGNKRKNGTVWLVRCVCGRYETRISKAVKNPTNNEDCCDECRQHIFLKNKHRSLL